VKDMEPSMFGDFKNGHYPSECPAKVNIQTTGGSVPHWIHGDCGTTTVKDIDEYRRTLYVNNMSDGRTVTARIFADKNEEEAKETAEMVKLGYFLARMSEDGAEYVIINLSNVTDVTVKKGWYE